MMNSNILDRIVKPLLAWYDKGHRELPWREDKNPYRIWVSEIMLQQTRVEAVIPYFTRFMDVFPDIRALAMADDDLLLKNWEGLGYYSRARNLKKAAGIIEEQYGGRMPDTWEELQMLPGIGSYTAGAIASIAYGRCVPAVDGNVLRVLSRLRMDDEFITRQAVKKRVEEELLAVMPEDRPGDFNQALMELGATVCIPNGEPKCGECPWKELCLAKAQGCTNEYPKKEKKKGRKIELKTVLILKYREDVAIHKRPDKGLLAGLYELPNLEGHLDEEEVISRLRDKGVSPIRIERLPDAVHVFSHKEWHMVAYAVRIDELLEKGIDTKEEYLFIHPKETEAKYPIPSAFLAYAEYLNIKLGNEKFEKRGN
ncbi:MAG: A/G-specific adenine glycosylase [Lachnospiraceae bacterium]|nr:A/G-specific adenine glycosylase [Lachnospiraceae bacterium]